MTAKRKSEGLTQVAEYLPKSWMGPRRRVGLDTGSDSKTEQWHRETTDMNKIVARYIRAGGLPPGPPARYADVSEIGDLMDVKLKMADAMEAYENLPIEITSKFNSPDEFLAYVENLEDSLEKPEKIDSETEEKSGTKPAAPRSSDQEQKEPEKG